MYPLPSLSLLKKDLEKTKVSKTSTQSRSVLEIIDQIVLRIDKTAELKVYF